jgi:exosortase D (VPLPA-CTERM-specific)
MRGGEPMVADAFTSLMARRGRLSAPTAIYGLLLLLAIGGSAVLFSKIIQSTVSSWIKLDEYNYGPLVPLVAALMVWRDASRCPNPPTASGFGVVGLATIGLLLGLLSWIGPFSYPSEIGLILVCFGLLLAYHGSARIQQLWPGIAYLIFSFPLPGTLRFDLSAYMQGVSSELGTNFIRWFDIPVLLEGNVIDLGSIQLQVAEACSGLRYLFPLTSFSFLCAYLFISPRWQKIVILLSAAPIAIIMNSLRIGITGLLVSRYGVAAAEGFFHAFEGWIVFCGCIMIIFLEMKALAYLSGSDRSLLRRLDLGLPNQVDWDCFTSGMRQALRPTAYIVGLLLAAVAIAPLIGSSTDKVPERQSFESFPVTVGPWVGTPLSVDDDTLQALQTDDYLSANFFKQGTAPVNLWIAYYASQELGSSTHTPRNCVPSGGWTFNEISEYPVDIQSGNGVHLDRVNRAIIEKDGVRQLVYYWFDERNKMQTNEYAVKLGILRDAFAGGYTNGALVRLVTPIQDGETVETADERLIEFAKPLLGMLKPYLP